MKQPRHGDVVEVEWVDSESVHLGWAPVRRYLAASNRQSSYRTAGYWIAGSKRGLVIVALNLNPHNRSIDDIMSIPKVAVQKITVLGRSNKRVRKALKP